MCGSTDFGVCVPVPVPLWLSVPLAACVCGCCVQWTTSWQRHRREGGRRHPGLLPCVSF